MQRRSENSNSVQPQIAFLLQLRYALPVHFHRQQLALTLILGALGFSSGSTITRAADTAAPRIKFAQPIFDFGKIKAGETIRHTYFFTNVGSSSLEITNVQPACGCTAAANWTRRLEPGQSGQLPIEFNSANFSGPVQKTVAVYSNDPQEPSAVLQIQGNIWRPIDVTPQIAVLNILPDALQGSTSIKILNNTAEYLAATSPPRSSSTNVTVSVSTNEPGRELQLSIISAKGLLTGNFQVQITLDTTSTNLPVVSANVWVVVQPSLAIYPPQLMLPSYPLTNRTTLSVTVQSQSTNNFALTDPFVSLPGIELAVEQPITGRVYSVTLSFPQGYLLPTNSVAELTFKTNREQFSTVRVPILRMPPSSM